MNTRVSSLQTAAVALAFFSLMGCASGPPPHTVDHVDLQRYAGTWYEIARIPQYFENGCEGVTATYTLQSDGHVQVVNTCHQGTPTGKTRDVIGTARVVNAPANSQLKVMFFWPFEGDYWIFRLNDDYTTAAVGSPDKNSLWILHRTPQMPETEWQSLMDSLHNDGFPIDRLQKTAQQ